MAQEKTPALPCAVASAYGGALLRRFKATGSNTTCIVHNAGTMSKEGLCPSRLRLPFNPDGPVHVYVCDVWHAGGGAVLLVLSPGLSGLCLGIFTVLWGFTIMYGSYSRHSQRVVQVRQAAGRS